MKGTTRFLAIAGVAVLLANALYAFALPPVLDEVRPGMPYGIRASESPTVDAGTTFASVTEGTGIDARRLLWEGGDLPYPAVITGGLAAGDVDDDGWTDLYFPPGGPHHPARLYLNQGNWTFVDVTDEAGVNATGFGAGAVFGDMDNDGDPDLYTLVDARGHLYENDGTGRFTEVTREAGVSLNGTCRGGPCQPSSVAWLDHDLDGDLDLYVVNNLQWRHPDLHTSGQDYSSLITFSRGQRSVLFENDGNGSFTDVTRSTNTRDLGKGLGVTTSDVDRDGWPDILTANDITPNALFRNQGDGTFRNIAEGVGVDEKKSSMGIEARDVTGDGRPDIAISNFRGHGLTLFVQRPDGSFEYATKDRGLGASFRGTGWGVQAFDYDLDGWPDLAMAVGRAVPLKPHESDLQNVVFPELKRNAQDQLYRNLGEGWFAEATATAGAFGDLNNTRALLAVDLDNDGDLDVVRTNLQGRPAEVLRNDLDNGHGWLQLDLRGTESNRDGYGARVVVELPSGRTLTRELVSAGGYQTGLPHRLTIGLGDAQEAHVTVHWPSGTVQELGVLETGRYEVVEDAS